MLGHCLVVDEIDKAPVEVVQVLKGLIEDHEMRLGDGRQIINGVHYDQLALRGVDVSSFIRIHEDFRMIVLANPPGFPFHGNDFFRECGDLFSSFVMDNPDAESQLRVLTAYAPNIPHSILRRLIDAFEKLQQSFREGNITYPFSLRELIAVVKHMSRYPQDGVYEALNNVFNFDARDENTLRLVRNVLNAHLVQSIQKTGGMGKTFPFHVQLPKPHQPQTTVVPVPLPKTENDTFSVTLNASVINTAQNVRDIIFARKRNATDINAYNTHCWKENYLENEFSAVLAPHQHQQHASDWFTDWVGTQKMPFLQDTDEVLQVVPVGTFGDSDRSSGLVSFLIQREKKLLLATVLLPPTPLEYGSFVNTKTGMTNMGWSVGEVHYMEIGPYFMGCAPTDVSVEDFNFSGFQDAWKEGANAWPSAAAQTHRYGSLQKDYSSLPVVLLRCKSDYGKTYLVDLLAGCSPELTTVVSSPTLASPTGGTVPATTERTATRPARYYRAEEAVLPIPFSLLTKPLTASGEQSSKDKTVPSFVDVNPIDGIVSFVLAGSNTLYVWKEGALVSVTFPKSVESVYSFSPVFFNVSLAAEKKVKGILKLVLRGPDAHASYAQLPDGVTANIVDIIPSKDSEGDSQTSITPVTPEELVGSVWVDGVLDRANHVQRVTADGRKLSSDVKYMILEDVNASEKQLEYRLYPTPINTGAEETGYVVDRRQHQLIGVAAENGVERTVNVMDTKDKTQRFLFPLQRDMNSFQINSTHGTAYGYSKDVRELATADLNTERIQQRYNDWNTLLNGSAGQIGDGASAGAEDHVKDYKMEYSTPKRSRPVH
ncbi:AAA domain (dynein-related subfamily), putative [Angomonas deanei]|uniref:AAA domain (Dynein-related subfamily), putative n=1 Tax=Angomonas deanei TaxID=59799 RepID=A0A7G2CC47_9TRYP|nr:AAA domain (dynein-related subfamily), putative [Angomonas deanei]